MITRLLAPGCDIMLCCSVSGRCSGRSEAVEISNCCTKISTSNLDFKILGKPQFWLCIRSREHAGDLGGLSTLGFDIWVACFRGLRSLSVRGVLVRL